MRVRDAESRVPAPRPSRQVRRKASRALRGVRTRRHQCPEPWEEEARLRSAAGALLRPLPSPVSRSQPRRRTGLLPGEGTGTRRAACAALARLSFAPLSRLGFAFSVPTSSRRLGPAGSRRGLLPAGPFASLPFSLTLRPPLFFPGHFSPPSSHSLPASVRVPSSAWLPRREAEATPAPKASLTRSSRLAFRRTRAWPSEMGEERESRSLSEREKEERGKRDMDGGEERGRGSERER